MSLRTVPEGRGLIPLEIKGGGGSGGEDWLIKFPGNFIIFCLLQKPNFKPLPSVTLFSWLPLEHCSSKMGKTDTDPLYSTLCPSITSSCPTTKFHLNTFQNSVWSEVIPVVVTYGKHMKLSVVKRKEKKMPFAGWPRPVVSNVRLAEGQWNEGNEGNHQVDQRTKAEGKAAHVVTVQSGKSAVRRTNCPQQPYSSVSVSLPALPWVKWLRSNKFRLMNLRGCLQSVTTMERPYCWFGSCRRRAHGRSLMSHLLAHVSAQRRLFRCIIDNGREGVPTTSPRPSVASTSCPSLRRRRPCSASKICRI